MSINPRRWSRERQVWAAAVAFLTFVGLVAQAKPAYDAMDDWQFATHAFVTGLIAPLGDELVRNRIDILRESLKNLNAVRPQVDDLRAKNPGSDLLRMQLGQLDKDIADTDRTIRVMVCDLNKRTTRGFVC